MNYSTVMCELCEKYSAIIIDSCFSNEELSCEECRTACGDECCGFNYWEHADLNENLFKLNNEYFCENCVELADFKLKISNKLSCWNCATQFLGRKLISKGDFERLVKKQNLLDN